MNMGPRFGGWILQTPNTHKDSNETQLCHLQRKITQDYKRATKSPRICSNVDQQKLDVTFAIMEVNARIQQHLATFAPACTRMDVTRLAWIIWGLNPKATQLLFTASVCASQPRPAGLHRHMYPDVCEGQLKTKFWGNVKQNKQSSVWEQHQTSDQDYARSWNTWQTSERRPSSPELNWGFISDLLNALIEWTHSFSHSYLWGDLVYVTLLL